MAKKTKKATKKQIKSTPKKQSKSPKPKKRTTKPSVTVEAEHPTVQAQTAPVVEVVAPVPPPQPDPTPPPQPEPVPPAPATLIVTSRKSIAGQKVLAQIGRHIVHTSRSVKDELVITDTTTGKPVANIHENVPLPVIRWIVECAEAIQDNPTMDDVVKAHGMTNVKAFCGRATELELSKYQAPPPDTVRAVAVG